MNTRRILFVSVLGALLSLAAGVSADQEAIYFTEPIFGTVEISPQGFAQERIAIPDSLKQILITIDNDVPLVIQSWPVTPAPRSPAIIERHEVIHAEARMSLITPSGIQSLDPSQRIHFWGTIDENHGRLMLSMDPDTGSIRGFAVTGGEIFELIVTGSRQLVLRAEDRLAAEGVTLDPWTCSLEDGSLESVPTGNDSSASGPDANTEAGSRTATIAFDTDTELMQLKFSNNQAAAINYIADLVAAMNAMYERDLDVTLLQGHTIIRIGSDPYTQNSGGNASSSELSEFSSYWSANYNHIDRALAAMLSGKQPGTNSASGIAWVGGLCSRSYGYSFTKVFKINYLAGDTFVAGHELGHNFGSRHTHCYSPPIDQCYANEGGCYSGATSCPGGPGTLMSYCHVAGCGSNRLQFHSRVIGNILSNHVNPALGVCIFDAVQPLFSDGFESGTTTAWSSTSP